MHACDWCGTESGRWRNSRFVPEKSMIYEVVGKAGLYFCNKTCQKKMKEFLKKKEDW